MISAIIMSMVLHATPPQLHNTRDITFEAPRFNNAPRFRHQRGMRGENPVDRPRDHRRKQGKNQEKLDTILVELYGDKYKIIRWRGNLLILKKVK